VNVKPPIKSYRVKTMKEKTLVGLRLSDEHLKLLDDLCVRYGYTRAGLAEFIMLKCLLLTERWSYPFLIDTLKELMEKK